MQEITRLFELVIKQEKKYEDRLSPHSNFYYRHVMVQQFFQIQLETKSSLTRREFLLYIVRFFIEDIVQGEILFDKRIYKLQKKKSQDKSVKTIIFLG